MAGSYELYAEVLRRTAVKVAGEIGWEIEPSRAQFLPDSVARWSPFARRTRRWTGSPRSYDVGIISNIDDKLLGISRRHLRTELDLVVTAQQVRSYKPDNTHFSEARGGSAARRAGCTSAPATTNDIAPLLKMNVPVIWVNRHGEKLEGRKAPTRDGQEPPRRRGEARRRRLALRPESFLDPEREVQVPSVLEARGPLLRKPSDS